MLESMTTKFEELKAATKHEQYPRGKLNSVLRAIPSSEGTELVCRLPLRTLSQFPGVFNPGDLMRIRYDRQFILYLDQRFKGRQLNTKPKDKSIGLFIYLAPLLVTMTFQANCRFNQRCKLCLGQSPP